MALTVNIIMHVISTDDWNTAYASGFYTPPSLDADGFIHCSTFELTVETANAFFSGQDGLMLLCIDADTCDAEVKFEPPACTGDTRTDILFPHIYGPLNISAVVKTTGFPCGADGTFVMPSGLSAMKSGTGEQKEGVTGVAG